MAAVAILKKLNVSGAGRSPWMRRPFGPARYGEYLDKARKAGDDTALRHYWELCVILALRDGLRSGDIFVPGSRRYADPATYLYTPQQWQPKQAEYCRRSASLPGPPTQSPWARRNCTPRWRSWRTLSRVRCRTTRDRAPGFHDKLVIPRLSAEDVPAEARELKESWPGCCRSRRSLRC